MPSEPASVAEVAIAVAVAEPASEPAISKPDNHLHTDVKMTNLVDQAPANAKSAKTAAGNAAAPLQTYEIPKSSRFGSTAIPQPEQTLSADIEILLVVAEPTSEPAIAKAKVPPKVESRSWRDQRCRPRRLRQSPISRHRGGSRHCANPDRDPDIAAISISTTAGRARPRRTRSTVAGRPPQGFSPPGAVRGPPAIDTAPRPAAQSRGRTAADHVDKAQEIPTAEIPQSEKVKKVSTRWPPGGRARA